MKRLRWSCLLSAVVALALGTAARADDFRSARVSDVRGSLAVRGPDDDDVSYIERNAVVRPGDVLWTDDDGKAEIELDRGAWVRLAEDTKLDLRAMPPSAEFRLWNGSVYFDLSDRVDGKTLLKTPVGDVEIERNSVVRIDLDRAESARVSVYNGRARAFPDSGSSIGLGTGERVYLEAGKPVADPSRFDRGELDGFDRYQRERVDYFINRPLPKELREDVIGARELHDYGTWVTVESTRYWQPRCEPGWRPYSAGYWSYIPGSGYNWIDYSPWGYTTSHYGRWLYRPVYGWLWSPGYVWGPAYVSWSTYGNYCGWAPLDPWNRPCYYGSGNGFGFGFGTGNWFVDFRSWTFCDRDRFFYGRHHRNYGGGFGRSFFAGHEIKLRRDGFRAVTDVHREIGIPRQNVRGVTVSDRGRLARDRVLRLEDRVPAGRQRLIEDRFKVAFNRDRDLVKRGSDLDRLQRDAGSKLDPERVLRGEDAARRVGRRPADQASDGNNRNDRVADRNPNSGPPRDRNNDRADNKPGDRVAGNERDSPFRRGSDRSVDRGGADRGPDGRQGNGDAGKPDGTGRDGVGRAPGGDRNSDAGKPEGTPNRGNDRDSIFRRDGNRNGGDRGGAGSGNGTPAGTGDRTGPRNGDRNSDRQPGDGAGRGNDPQDAQRRENERREAERRDGEKRDASQREAAQREAAQREAAQREVTRQENERREAERRNAEKRDNDRREAERRDNERRESERRESERRENDRREAERRDSERRESERRESERRESEKRDSPRRGSEFPSRGFGGGTGSTSPDDRFRRGGTGGTGSEAPSYRDYRAPSLGSPSTGAPSGSTPNRDSGFRRTAPSGGDGVRTAPSGTESGSRYNRYPGRSTTPDTGSPSSGYSRPGYSRSYGGSTGGTTPSYGGSTGSPYSRGGSYSGGSPYTGGSTGPGRSYGGGYSGGSSSGSSRSYGGGGYSGGGSSRSSGGGSSSRGSSDSGRGSLRR